MKRKLLSSFFFDCETAENTSYLPVCIFSHDLTNSVKPLQLCVKYAWQDFTVNYPLNDRLKENIKKSGELFFLQTAKTEIINRLQYNGKFEIDTKSHFHISKEGRKLLKTLTL